MTFLSVVGRTLKFVFGAVVSMVLVCLLIRSRCLVVSYLVRVALILGAMNSIHGNH